MPLTSEFPQPLGLLVDLALAAGQEIMAERASRSGWELKPDGSVVTLADLASERIIVAGLEAEFPGLPIVAEERVSSGVLPVDIGDRFFLVDPLDGTREYVDGRAEFTVNIALVENGVPAMGVVIAPALGEGFAGLDKRAWTFRIGDKDLVDLRPVRARPRPARLAAVVSRSHATPETLRFLEQFEISDQMSYGSSLKLCKVAEGVADIYPRLGRTMEWDIAAGDAILRAAGGSVTTLDGKPLRYGKSAQASDHPFANPSFVAFGAWSESEIRASFAAVA